MTDMLDAICPGEILLEEFLRPMNISQNQLARDINVPVSRVADIVNGKRAISADTALRLSRAFGLSDRFWLNLQVEYDIRRLKASDWQKNAPQIRVYESAAQ